LAPDVLLDTCIKATFKQSFEAVSLCENIHVSKLVETYLSKPFYSSLKYGFFSFPVVLEKFSQAATGPDALSLVWVFVLHFFSSSGFYFFGPTFLFS
jgi:hypothetical protein